MRVLNKLIAITILTGVAFTAHAHSWYSTECCTVDDCQSIPPGSRIEPNGDGFNLTLPDGEVLYYSREKLRASQDGVFHYCAAKVKYGDHRNTFCLYIPLGS